MSFKIEGNDIKLESINDKGNPLDIEKYKDTPLLTIGNDGKYMGISQQVPVSSSSPPNTQQLDVQTPEVAQLKQEQEAAELKKADALKAQDAAEQDAAESKIASDTADSESMGGQRKNKTKRMKAGKKNKSKRVRFMSRRNRRR